jgi:hypothetical protein
MDMSVTEPTDVPHSVAVDAYEPDPLPDYAVFDAVLDVTADTLRREVQR